MNVIVVTGCPWSRYQEIFDLLSTCGIASAKPAERSSAVSMAAWHGRALPAGDEFAAHSAAQPGRALDQVAADIFVANWDQPVWGWADHRSAWLLEYWRDFDNAVCFVLVCTPPEIAIGRAITDISRPPQALEQTSSVWLAYHREMMRFYHRFRDRCVLISETEVAAYPQGFIECCRKSLALPLNSPSATGLGHGDDPLGLMLARQYLDSIPEMGELWREIDASRSELPGLESPPVTPTASTAQVIGAISNLIRTSAAQLASVTEERNRAEQGKSKAEQQVRQLEQQLAAANGESEQQKKRAEDALLEGELLLSQLHQTQEELESYYLQNQELDTSLQQSKKEITEVQAERNELEKRAKHFYQEAERLGGSLRKQEELAKQRQADLAALTKDRDEERLKAATLKKEGDTLRASLQEREAALSAAAKNLAEQTSLAAKLKQDLEEAHAILKQRDAAVQSAQDALALTTRESEELRSALSRQEQTIKQNQDALRKAEQTVQLAVNQRDAERSQTETLRSDRELILAQLNQVQEELERQFSQNKQLKKAYAAYDRRWQKLIRRYPDYLHFDSIEIIDATQTGSAAALQWRISGLFAGKRLIPQFDLATLLIGGNVAMLLQRHPEQGANGPLLSWPLEAAEQGHIVLQPKGPDEDIRQRWSILQGLSTSDWQTVNALCTTLVEYLQVEGQNLPASLATELWIERLAALRDQFRSMPVGLRYDKAILRRQALHPDYEHLWIRLENTQFGDRHWPNFDFRLAASLIQPEGFSQYPKLEFPAHEEGPNQFENWFAETTDELGARYELRFALADRAVDMAVFNRLTPTDQLQIISILVNLPAILTKLENSGVTLARPWEHWQQLTEAMIETLRHNLALAYAAPPSITEIEVSDEPAPAPRVPATGRSRKQTTRRR